MCYISPGGRWPAPDLRSMLLPEPSPIAEFRLVAEDLGSGPIPLRVFRFPGGLRDDRRAVVCIHGMAASGISFARQNPLADRWDFRMLSAPVDTYGGDSIGAFAAGVETYLRSLDRPVLLGTSWGALVSLTAAKGVVDRLSALVLTGAFARNTAIPWPLEFIRGVLPAVQAAAPSFAPLAARVVGGRGIDASARLELTREAREVSVAERKRRLEAVFQANLLDDLRLLDVPAIVIHGTRDRLVTRIDARELANRLPRATYHEIRGAGHVPYLSHPDEFNAILGDFLERVG